MNEIKNSMEVARLIKEIMSLIKSKFMKGFNNMGITAPQGMVMGILGKFGKTKISELSEKMGLSNSTVSGIVDRLERQGIVERERSSDDKRVVYASLTAEFEGMHQNFQKQMENNIGNILEKGTPADIDIIINGLNTLKKLLSIE